MGGRVAVALLRHRVYGQFPDLHITLQYDMYSVLDSGVTVYDPLKLGDLEDRDKLFDVINRQRQCYRYHPSDPGWRGVERTGPMRQALSRRVQSTRRLRACLIGPVLSTPLHPGSLGWYL